MDRCSLNAKINNISAEQIFSVLKGNSKCEKYQKNSVLNSQKKKCLSSQSIKERNSIISRKTYLNLKAFKLINKKILKQQCFKVIDCKHEDFSENNPQTYELRDNFFPKRTSPNKNNNAAKYFTNNSSTPTKLVPDSRQKNRSYTQPNQFSDDRFFQTNIKHQGLRTLTILSNLITAPTIQLKRIINHRVSTLPEDRIFIRRPNTSNSLRCKKRFVKVQKISPWDNIPHRNEVFSGFTEYLTNK